MPLKLPVEAQKVLETIEAAGGRGYVVGGAVRDMLLGRRPQDWDFAATLGPEMLLAIFPRSRLIGGDCGTVEVPFGSGWCQVTPCRSEDGYTDRRHPDRVVFVPDILADLSRRDFTVNAMAYDGAVLLDPFGGQQDIAQRKLRCVGQAAQRFEEDPLRVLRLFRFAAQLGFSADWDTYNAAGDAMPLVDSLPAERVLEEVRRMLMSDGPGVLNAVITKGGLRKYGFDFAPSLAVLAGVPLLPGCRWWALMALCGAVPEAVGEAFGFGRRTMDELTEYTRLYRAGPANDGLRLKQKLSHTRVEYGPAAATFAAVSPAFAAEPALFAALVASGEPYRLKDLAINGDTLRYEGIKGEKCGQVLDELLGAVIKNPALNKPQVLLGLARGLKQLL